MVFFGGGQEVCPHKLTFPTGNLRRNSGVLLVWPKWKWGGEERTLILAPLYCAAIRALKARQFSG